MASFKHILFLHRFGIKLYSPDNPVTPIFSQDSTDLEQTIESLRPYEGETMRVLLADQVSYTYKTVVPKVESENLRTYIQNQAKAELPENLDELTWDYKILETDSNQIQILVFAPIKETKKNLDTIAEKLNIKFESMEPESVSITRNPNPIVGLISKDDLVGKDENVLNISTQPKHVHSNAIPIILKILLIPLALGVGYFVFFYPKTRTMSPPKSPAAQVSPTPTLTPTNTPPPTTTHSTDQSALTIQIQNGSGKNGAAGALSEKLKVAGFNNLSTQNADRSDYPETTIIFKSTGLKDSFLSYFSKEITFKSSNVSVDTTQAFDVILVIGIK